MQRTEVRYPRAVEENPEDVGILNEMFDDECVDVHECGSVLPSIRVGLARPFYLDRMLVVTEEFLEESLLFRFGWAIQG
ncbi:hypothetical protein D3C75_1297760 [compost metagenome]